jgi:tetratricopeptide (TPR) repeat protein
MDGKLSPDEQRQWLTTFEHDDPGNALANYLSAMNYFNAGQIDQGIQDLSAAAGKHFDDYSMDRVQNDGEAYASAGYSTAEAQTIAAESLVLPQEGQIKQLGVDLVSLANAYSQSGDQASAQATLQMAMNLGQNTIDQSSDPFLINELVGMAVQKLALNAMDPNSIYGNSGQTAQQQLDELAQERANIKTLVNETQPILPTLSDQQMLDYQNRKLMFGEVAALQWVAGKYEPH